MIFTSDTGDSSLCLFSLAVFLFPGGPKALPGGVFAGKLDDFAGKQGEISASWATQRTVPCVSRVFEPTLGAISSGINNGILKTMVALFCRHVLINELH